MAENVNSYLDFAENDYRFFHEAYEHGIKGGPLAFLAQNICEKYLKHIVDTLAYPETDRERQQKQDALRTHSLRHLMNYIQDHLHIDIPDEAEAAIDRIDGFYFSTRYPGESSFFPTKRDIERSNTAVEYARETVFKICADFGLRSPQEQGI